MNGLSQILSVLVQIKDLFLSVCNFIFDIIQTLRFWFHSLTTWITEIFADIFWVWDLWGLIYYGWDSVWELIWWPATVIIASLLLIVMVRIIIAFVFKMLRLNIDYNTLNKKTYEANHWSKASEWHKRSATKV